MSLALYYLVFAVTLAVALLIDQLRDRSPIARPIAIAMVGLLFFGTGLIWFAGTVHDAISGRSIDMSRAGARVVSRRDDFPLWFWFLILLKASGSVLVAWAGLRFAAMGFVKD
ncbi:MAG TPA: hypothetical protein VD865_10955 [Stenotrophomonas sp.]|nr:hypothetical protein [Stenotrophomonas sp.]